MPVGGHDVMDVRWPVRMAVHELEQFASWTIVRHGVRCWSQAVEGIFALLVGQEFASQVVLNLLVILLLIET